MNKKIENFLAERNHREISLFAYIYSFLIIIGLATLLNLYMGKYYNAMIEIFALIFVGGLLIYLHVRHDIKTVSIILVWVATIAAFALAYFNDFKHATPLFLWLTPFGFYLVLDRKIVFFHSALYFFFMFLLLAYGYNYSENRLFFDDIDTLRGLVIGTVYVMTIGGFVYFAIEHSFDKLETSNRQKEFLLKEVHHRVKNNLNMISSILGLQSDPNDEKLQMMIMQNRERIQSIALVHEMLYQDENLDKVDCHGYVKKLSSHIVHACTKHTVKLNLEISSFFLPLDTMIHLGLMIQEMLVNSLKYAFEAQGDITIKLEKIDNKIHLTYYDNGKGCSPELIEENKGLGIELMQISTQKLRGTLNIRCENGLRYELEFEDVQS